MSLSNLQHPQRSDISIFKGIFKLEQKNLERYLPQSLRAKGNLSCWICVRIAGLRITAGSCLHFRRRRRGRQWRRRVQPYQARCHNQSFHDWMNDVTFKIGRRIGAHASTSRLFDSCICGESVTLKISFGSGFLSKFNSEGVTPDVFRTFLLTFEYWF